MKRMRRAGCTAAPHVSDSVRSRPGRWFVAVLLALLFPRAGVAENWPRWRGPDGNAVSSAVGLPVTWTATENIRWKTQLSGEGSSSAIIWGDRVFLTCALDDGTRRAVVCLESTGGRRLWMSEIDDSYPELTSALTGHAAATPVTDGRRVVAMFGNAGAVCYDFQGKQLWRRRFGEFDSELGLASSPILAGGRAILLCDHDGKRFKSFDSFLIALDVDTGEVVWKTERPGLFRSWSTPIVVPTEAGESELVVSAQDELRAYDPQAGQLIWTVEGMSGWVAPSPVFGLGLVFAASGKDGPIMAVRPGGRGNVTADHVVWQHDRGGPYVCSPVLSGNRLYVHNELGVLRCHDARTGQMLYRHRLSGKFTASAAAGDGKIYVTNEAGTTYVIQAASKFQLLATNSLDEACLASPAIANGNIFLRTQNHLYCIGRNE